MNFEEVLTGILEGDELGDAAAEAILTLSGDHLRMVYQTANALNVAKNQRCVSFIHNMNVNYTNICEYFCSFCEFGKSKDAPDTYILSEKDVLARIGDKPISEITYQGGLSDRVSFDDALGLLRIIKERRPSIHMHAFSPEEIHYYARATKLSYRDVIRRAHEAGMDSMCGTAAEILDDEVRKKICPTKISTDQWLTIIRTAHELGLRSTATILFGHVEEPHHVVRHLCRIRALQKETGGFTEFIPLLFMPDHTRLGKRMTFSGNKMEYAQKLIALARLYFSKTIRNIQTSWVKLGFDHALACLDIGANDMGGTLYYENITREAGGTNGEYTSPDTFRAKITAHGKIPVERDTLYAYQSLRHEVVHV